MRKRTVLLLVVMVIALGACQSVGHYVQRKTTDGDLSDISTNCRSTSRAISVFPKIAAFRGNGQPIFDDSGDRVFVEDSQRSVEEFHAVCDDGRKPTIQCLVENFDKPKQYAFCKTMVEGMEFQLDGNLRMTEEVVVYATRLVED